MKCRRPYDTDLTDPEWEHLKRLVPIVKPGGRPPKQLGAKSSTASFIQSAARVPGSCCRVKCHAGEPSIITSGHGVAIEPGRRFTTVFGRRYDKQPAAIWNPSGAGVETQSVVMSEQRGMRGYDVGKNGIVVAYAEIANRRSANRCRCDRCFEILFARVTDSQVGLVESRAALAGRRATGTKLPGHEKSPTRTCYSGLKAPPSLGARLPG
jgi:hypothetical protein